MGASRLYSLSPERAKALLLEGTANAEDLLCVSGVVHFERAELVGMLGAGEMRVVPPGEELAALWPRVWALTDDDGTTNDDLSDGTEVWWRASQCGAAEAMTGAAPAELADEALEEWIKFFARGLP